MDAVKLAESLGGALGGGGFEAASEAIHVFEEEMMTRTARAAKESGDNSDIIFAPDAPHGFVELTS